MLRTAFLCLFLFVSFSSTTILRKSLVRRQSEPTQCQAIEGFDCQCSIYRITCTSSRALPTQINVLQNEKQKYPSVELIINGEQEQHVYEYTFEPIQQLFKPDADNLEFRIKFEKFTALHLAASVFNRVFPSNAPSTTRKHLGLEIYNPTVQPVDNVNLFANLNVDGLELYVLYPFRGTFQQLFNGANIKYLRLSGGDIRSDLSQPFTGNIGRLELAKQASQINVQNFPIYPAHELIINAFYVTDFNSDNPPNYSNLGELRIYSQERIPANAFRQFSNLHTLSIATEKDIDPHAFDGLYNLEKLTIKDTKPSLELLNSLHNLKEFETSLEKLGEAEQCQLVEKLANGQLAVQAIPSGRECTCTSAYLDSASGRYPCDAPNCEQSSCPAIRNNFDATARTFKTPPTIRRADGSDALRQREPKVYTSAYQISNQDRDKSQQGASQQEQPQQQPSYGQEGEDQQQQSGVTAADQQKKSRRTRPRTQTTTPSYGQQNPDEQGQYPSDHEHHHHPGSQPSWDYNIEHERHSSSVVENNPIDSSSPTESIDTAEIENERSVIPWDYPNDYEDNFQKETPSTPSDELTTFSKIEEIETTTVITEVPPETSNQGDSDDSAVRNEEEDNQAAGDDNGNRQDAGETTAASDVEQSTQVVDAASSGEQRAKRKFGWLPIIIIVAAIAALLLLGLIVLIIRRKRAAGYNPTPTSEAGTTK